MRPLAVITAAASNVVIVLVQINAMANRATGKGYENETFYSNIKFQFWGIDNIHVMRASLQKLVEGSSLMSAGRVPQVDATVVTAALCVQISLTSINLVQLTNR